MEPVTSYQPETAIVQTRDEYRASYNAVQADLNKLRYLYREAVERIDSGSQAEAVAFGQGLAEVAKEKRSYSNGVAAILEEYREMYRVRFSIIKPENVGPAQASLVAPVSTVEIDGTYTVVFGEEYETIRIETIKGGKFDGKVIASFLSGPDNETDFTGFGFVNGQSVNVWSRFKNLAGSRKDYAVRIILEGSEERRLEGREVYALRSGRCSRCHRKLTVPASLHRGLGPDCAAKLGLI